MSWNRNPAALILFSAVLATGCDEAPTGPSSDAIITFKVSDETFRARLTTPEQIAAAEAAQNGGRAKIPNGRIVLGTEVNSGWRWHLDEVEFAEATIEVCDGRPSDVEAQGTSFGGGRYCPWSATIVGIDKSR